MILGSVAQRVRLELPFKEFVEADPVSGKLSVVINEDKLLQYIGYLHQRIRKLELEAASGLLKKETDENKSK